nr:immunoglobulin heavy chain junction region [Homo sapiens]
LCDRRGHGC